MSREGSFLDELDDLRFIGSKRRPKGKPARFFRSVPSFAQAPAVQVELAQSTVVNVPEADEDDQTLMSKVIAKCIAVTLRPDKLKLPWRKKKKQLKLRDDPAPPEPAPIKPEREVKLWISSKTVVLFQVA